MEAAHLIAVLPALSQAEIRQLLGAIIDRAKVAMDRAMVTAASIRGRSTASERRRTRIRDAFQSVSDAREILLNNEPGVNAVNMICALANAVELLELRCTAPRPAVPPAAPVVIDLSGDDAPAVVAADAGGAKPAAAEGMEIIDLTQE